MSRRRPGIIRRIMNRIGVATLGQVREAMSNIQMATVNRLTSSWTTSSVSADSQARLSLSIVRARSRQLREDNDYAAKFCSMVRTNVLGENGIHFRSNVKELDLVRGNKLTPGQPDVFANKVIEDAWWLWGKKEQCTVHGTMSWCDVQRVVLEEVAVAGECIIRLIRNADNNFGFSLKIYDAEQLDDTLNVAATPGGNEIRMGVELDENHKPIAYHLLKQNPAEINYWRGSRTETERVPAADIIHLGIRRRPNQTRCFPWMSTSGYRLNHVGKYEEAEVIGKRAASAKMGFFVRQQGTASYTGEQDTNGNLEMQVEPGAFEQLPDGWDIKSFDWNHEGSDYAAFLKTSLRGVAAGLGVSYNSLANDMESVNFASGKLGLLEERECWKIIQNWFIESFCEVVFAEWLKNALLTQAVPLPDRKFDKFNSPVFRARRWQHIDPSKDTDAEIRQLNAGLTSHSRLLASRNIDIKELLDEVQAEKEEMRIRGLTFPELMAKTVDAVSQGIKKNPKDDNEDLTNEGQADS